MKKNFKIAMLSMALILIVASALTAKPVFKDKDKLSSASFAGELYWYATDDVTYTGRFKNISDEMAYLTAAYPLYAFYSTQVSASVAYEFGYSVNSPAGTPAQTIYRKLR